MGYDVFISYNSNDRELIKQFTQELKNIGIRVFIDIWDLTPGEPWQEEIEKNMLNSKYIVIFIGKNGLGPWQNAEMRLALDLKIKYSLKVIPVLFPKANVEKIPLFLTQLTWIDFRKGLDNTKQYNRLVSTLGISKIENMKDNIFYKNKKLIKQTLILPSKNDLINTNAENILVHLVLIIYFSMCSIYSSFLSQEIVFEVLGTVLVVIIFVYIKTIELIKKRNDIFSHIENICDLAGTSIFEKNMFNVLEYIDCETCKVKTPSILIFSVKNTIQRLVNLLLKIVPVFIIYTVLFPSIEGDNMIFISLLLLLYFSHSLHNTMNFTMKRLNELGYFFIAMTVILFVLISSIFQAPLEYIVGVGIPIPIIGIILGLVIIIILKLLEIENNFKCCVCTSINKKK